MDVRGWTVPKLEKLTFCHMGTYGEAELLDGKPHMVSWKTGTAAWSDCGPRLRHSVERAIQETKGLDTPFVRLGRLESEIAEMRGQLTELAAMVAAKLGRA